MLETNQVFSLVMEWRLRGVVTGVWYCRVTLGNTQPPIIPWGQDYRTLWIPGCWHPCRWARLGALFIRLCGSVGRSMHTQPSKGFYFQWNRKPSWAVTSHRWITSRWPDLSLLFFLTICRGHLTVVCSKVARKESIWDKYISCKGSFINISTRFLCYSTFRGHLNAKKQRENCYYKIGRYLVNGRQVKQLKSLLGFSFGDLTILFTAAQHLTSAYVLNYGWKKYSLMMPYTLSVSLGDCT